MRNDALSVVSKLAASPNNVFTRPQAALLGLGHRDIATLKASGLVAEPWRNTLVGYPPLTGPTWLQMITAATTGREAWAAARSAARLHGVDGLVDVCDLDLGCEHSVNVRLGGVNVRRTSTVTSLDLVIIGVVPCTNLARTLCDLGDVVDAAVLERAFDDVVRRGANPRWIRETAIRAAAPRILGPRRVLDLLEAHERRGVVRGSWFEKLLEMCLDPPELDGLVLQHTLRAEDGSHVATFDLAMPDAKLGIEAHSRKHHFGAKREAADEHRDNEAGVEGWDVMYLGYAEVLDTRFVRDLVVRRVRARRAQLAAIEHGATPA